MSGNYATPPPQSATQETTLGQSNGFVDGSYPCGSIFGIPLRVHKLFVAYIVIVSVLGFVQGGLEGKSELGFMLFLVHGPILFGTVLIHELGHCWATYRIGGMVEGILLWPLGGLASSFTSSATAGRRIGSGAWSRASCCGPSEDSRSSATRARRRRTCSSRSRVPSPTSRR